VNNTLVLSASLQSLTILRFKVNNTLVLSASLQSLTILRFKVNHQRLPPMERSRTHRSMLLRLPR